MEQARAEVRPVSGDPEARAAEPCDEHCDPDCVHHTPSVGWDLSFGSRINFHPVDTQDGRMVVSLHLSDDATAKGMVYREVKPEQVAAFALHLLELVAPGGTWRVRYISRPDVGEPERPMGIHDFPTEREARAYFESDEVRSQIGTYWRAELQYLAGAQVVESLPFAAKVEELEGLR
jgi:hypothetical protein